MGFDAYAYLQQKTWTDMKLGLERIEALLDSLGRPDRVYDVVHIAGTNGKGSTSAFIASILQEAGYTVGLFTSPFIVDFNERIRVNGENISDEDIVEVTLQVKEIADNIKDAPSSFEVLTAVALQYFAQKHCDVVVLETGLGGRFDATNATTALISAITPIAFDHMEILGNTLADIAAEKAGIIKQNVPVVVYPQEREVWDVIQSKALSLNAPVISPDFSELSISRRDLSLSLDYKGIHAALPLVGSYQPYNACMAIEIVRALNNFGYHIANEHIVSGLEHTRWQGRFQVVCKNPLIVVDGGHNQQGARELLRSLQDIFVNKPLHIVVGVLADKDWKDMMDIVMPHAKSAACIEVPFAQRALPAKDLALYIHEKHHISAQAYGSYKEALQASSAYATFDNGVVCCFGSLYSLGEIFSTLRQLGLYDESLMERDA
ncbi:MAG: bifunctional folylpolyglutamate synthase/dihydrofolate synthase [Eggerthellaceae bacterium]|nr:bifunctional folylpolyglutamate synthase/dihydrofolate synthase [Eggerthellaceae bacterium]